MNLTTVVTAQNTGNMSACNVAKVTNISAACGRTRNSNVARGHNLVVTSVSTGSPIKVI